MIRISENLILYEPMFRLWPFPAISIFNGSIICNTLWWWCSKYCIYAPSLNNSQMVQLQPHLQHTLMMLKVHAYALSLNITNGSIAKHFDDIHIMRLCIVLGISQNSSDCNTLWWCSKYMNLCIFFWTSQMVQFATCFNDAQSYMHVSIIFLEWSQMVWL